MFKTATAPVHLPAPFNIGVIEMRQKLATIDFVECDEIELHEK